MTAAAPSLPHPHPFGDDDPLRDHAYRRTPIGREIVAWLKYLELSNLRPKTLEDYERNAAYLAQTYPTLRLEQVTDVELLTVIAAWPKAGRRTRTAALKNFFRWARRTRRITDNPVELLPEMREKRRKHIDVFTDAEIDDLYALPAVDSILMRILFEAGLRKGEAIALQVRRLKLTPEPAEIVVVGGKGGQDRTVLMSTLLRESVQAFLILERLGPQDHLWYSRPGGGIRLARDKPVADASFGTWWRRCLDEAGVRYRNPHVARHTFATRWLRRGGPLTVLSEEMGHASIKTTYDFYGHLDKRDAIAAHKAMEAGQIRQDS